ncbi:MAG: hypothetical protein F6K35_25415, partial [Okeania sp. SIO2H7]|nr:hypothetical protein [Okeania sp. SIO2H7]
KVKKLEFQQVESGIYQNIGTVVADGVNDSDPSHYVNGEPDPQNPGIEIEKSTNGVDADAPEDAPEIAPGDTVTWTYKVTNTGNVSFAENEIQVTDDQEGTITNIINKGDGDDTLAPDEMWTYQKTGTAQNLTGSGGQTQTFNLTGNSGLDGQDGNIRTFTAGDVSVKASAFSRTNSGNWSEAFLGAFSSGLGVTDTSEGNGGNDRHKVDNVGRDNYILFEFSEDVVIDRTFLDSVGADSDITYWVGSKTDAFNNHNTLDDGFLNSLEFTQDNNGESSSRWANINNQQVAGNVLVIAASTSDNTPDDRFKVKKLEFQQVESGIYQNIGTVVADGVNDSDPSHYVNGEPDPQPGQNSVLFSLKYNQTLDGISFTPEDIVEYNVADQSYSKFFDGSDVGLGGVKINAFEVIGNNEILLSFEDTKNISGIGNVDDSDIVKFTATSLGDNTDGSFELYFDGSDVGLKKNGEDIDGLSVDPLTGDLLISTQGNVNVSGVSRQDEDILRFNPNNLGSNTSGSWSVEFDGSDVELSDSSENLDAIGINGEQLLLSTTGNFNVPGVSGKNQDVFAFNPNNLGVSTSGTFEELFTELNGNDISGVHFLG